MMEVPDNTESPVEPDGEPEAPGPDAGPGRPPDRFADSYIARLQALPVWPEVPPAISIWSRPGRSRRPRT